MDKGANSDHPRLAAVTADRETGLSPDIYRRFLMLSCAFPGTRAAPGSLIMKVHEGGDEPPLFWCGDLRELPAMAEVHGSRRSIFFIRSTFEVLPPSERTICELARYYATEIVRIQPQGPYFLAGFCEAGLIALEIARTLKEEQRLVGLLTLVDTDVSESNLLLRVARRIFGTKELLGSRYMVMRQRQPDRPLHVIPQLLQKLLRKLLNPSQPGGSGAGSASTPTPAANTRPDDPRYQLKAYPGKLDLMFIRWGEFGFFQFALFQRYWRKLAPAGARFLLIPGQSHDFPDWHAIAEQLRILWDRSMNADLAPDDGDSLSPGHREGSDVEGNTAPT